MFQNLRKSRRGISPVLAAVMLISLVVAASAIVGVLIMNIDVVDLPWEDEEISAKEVHLTLTLMGNEDTDLDTLFDKISLFLSLDVDSPTIYVNDIDLILTTGQTVDAINPWIISVTSQTWNDGLYGYSVPYGTINSSFDIQASDLSINAGELESGSFIYIIINYSYLSDLSARITTISSFYQSPLITVE
ncbi:MAG: hypothetical protein KGD64_02370 [Candidatus Heimdallarchaeota archaeon]|nr:hypothetical protein [Candidatus Heimdallarchaeota archaeon]